MRQINTDIIRKYEGLRLDAYLCPAGVWSIGYGTTIYPNGKKVKQGERISKIMAERILEIDVQERIKAMRLPAHLTDNQVSALVSFAYNVGVGAFLGSTLRQKVLLNDKDPSIRNEFLKWKIAGGKVFKGLLNRRHEESNLYFNNL